MVPPIRMRTFRSFLNRASLPAIMTPPTTAEWPLMNLVRLGRTTSAPNSSGFCSMGLEKVLSTTRRRLCFLASRLQARRSVRIKVGLAGVSIYSRRGAGRADERGGLFEKGRVNRRYGGHARGGGQRAAAALEKRQVVLERLGRGIADPGVDVSRTRSGERVLAVARVAAG